MPGYGRNNITRQSAKGSAANKEVTLTLLKPEADKRMFIQGIFAGYGGSGTLAGGLLTVEDGFWLPGESSEPNKVELPIGSKGAQELALGYEGGPGKAIVLALAAGGSEVTGYLTVLYYIN